MGVTILQQYPVKDRTGPQTIDSLSKKIIALGARQSGQFLVDCETHVCLTQPIDSKEKYVLIMPDDDTNNVVTILTRGGEMVLQVFLGRIANKYIRQISGNQQRTVHVLHNSEQPASVFSILDTGTKTIPIVADTLFDLLLMKMNTILQRRQKIESRGPRFELCDFCIKIGSVTTGQNFKGVLLEIEYRPCVIPSNCWEFMKEFIQGFLGINTLNVPPQYLQNRMNDVYQPIDTIQQYLEHFNIFRKTTGTGIMQYN